MSIRLDISKGIDPIPMFSDIRTDEHYFRIDGIEYIFKTTLPFTLKEAHWVNAFGKLSSKKWRCADKALVLKHKDKAYIKDLRTMEVVK